MSMHLIQSKQITMSSREIAELTGKRHDNVMVVVRSLRATHVVSPEIQETPYLNEQNGQTYFQFLLSKRDSLVVVARLSPEFTARIVDRWQELEASQTTAIPRSFSEALRLAAEQAELIEQQQAALAMAAPKIEFVDNYVESNGLKGFREVAKLLKIKEPEFRCFLTDNNIMYRLGGEWTAYQHHIDAGRFSVKAGVSHHSDHAFNSCKFTPKGVEWIAGLIASKAARRELEGMAA